MSIGYHIPDECYSNSHQQCNTYDTNYEDRNSSTMSNLEEDANKTEITNDYSGPEERLRLSRNSFWKSDKNPFMPIPNKPGWYICQLCNIKYKRNTTRMSKHAQNCHEVTDTSLTTDKSTIWSVSDTLLLISKLRNAPELWKKNHPRFHDRNLKAETLVTISKELGYEATAVERRIKSLRCQFSREHLRMLQGKQSTWFAYEPLSAFLSPEHKTTTSIVIKDDVDFDHISEIEIDEEELDASTEEGSLCGVEGTLDANNANWPNDSTRKRYSENTIAVSSFKKMKLSGLDSTTYLSSTDEITAFVTCVEQKLRNIKHARARTIAQHVINSVLFQAEMTNYADDFEYTGVDFTLFENTCISGKKWSSPL